MTPRAILLRQSDALHCKGHDRVIRNALGLILSGCVILGWIALRLTPKQIGA